VKRWLPAPLLSLALFAAWLALNRSTQAAHIVLGAVLAVAIPALLAPLRPPGGPMRKPFTLAALVLTVGGDLIVSGIQVARGVIRSDRRPPCGTFVVLPLELRDPFALAALSTITTVVPGTVWSELAPDSSALLLHVFDIGDEAEFIAFFKHRYERPLREIFE
jgi:multicomponent K+:H+ antiporter subunit E